MQRQLSILILTTILTTTGCAGPQTQQSTQQTSHSPFTHGNVQLTIKPNTTTQAQILDVFGPPNIATTDSSGNEVWSYQKNATVTNATENSTYGTVLLAGGRTTSTGFEQSSRTMTLIIKFDANKKVIDFKSMTSSF